MSVPGLLLVFASLLAASPSAVVIEPVANMFSSASEDADVVSQAIYSSSVEILEESGGWARIRTPDDYTGWVPRAALLKSGKPYARAGRVAEVLSLAAHLYRENSVTKHKPLLTVPFETRLEVIAEPDEGGRRWLQVRLPDDRAAWIQRGDVSLESRKLSTAETIELARKFIGIPYTWGGTSSFGFDCSGFTQMLCRRRGSMLPRDAAPQAEWTGVRPVAKSELEAGDLVFFSSSGRKITHVGLYIGSGEFINATVHEKPMVKIDRLDDPHWAGSYAGARRFK